MSTTVAAQDDEIRRRASLLRDMLTNERWTARKVAMKIGVSHTYVNARLRGEVDLTFSDVESIAPLLRLSGPALYGILADTKMAPTPKGEGQDMARPEGFEPPTFWSVADDNVVHLIPRANTEVDDEHDAVITALPRRA